MQRAVMTTPDTERNEITQESVAIPVHQVGAGEEGDHARNRPTVKPSTGYVQNRNETQNVTQTRVVLVAPQRLIEMTALHNNGQILHRHDSGHRENNDKLKDITQRVIIGIEREKTRYGGAPESNALEERNEVDAHHYNLDLCHSGKGSTEHKDALVVLDDLKRQEDVAHETKHQTHRTTLGDADSLHSSENETTAIDGIAPVIKQLPDWRIATQSARLLAVKHIHIHVDGGQDSVEEARIMRSRAIAFLENTQKDDSEDIHSESEERNTVGGYPRGDIGERLGSNHTEHVIDRRVLSGLVLVVPDVLQILFLKMRIRTHFCDNRTVLFLYGLFFCVPCVPLFVESAM